MSMQAAYQYKQYKQKFEKFICKNKIHSNIFEYLQWMFCVSE